IADSLANARKAAVWLGNLAVQHERAAELQVLSQEISRLAGGTFGLIGEAANSTGGYLANAVPGSSGLSARQMIAQPRQAYVLLNAEPDLDFADPTATQRALGGAQLVVALSAFVSPALLSAADVLLPV